jgi:hypothetical protein
MPMGKSLAHAERTRLDGAIEAATTALDEGLTTIAGVHRAIARKPFAALRLTPGVGDVSEGVRVVHDGITNLVYGGIRAGVAVAGKAAQLAASLANAGQDEPPPGQSPRRVPPDARMARY